MSPDRLRELAYALDPGAALVAVLVEHVWAPALEDAAMRTGGTFLATVARSALAELAPSLLASVGAGGTSTSN